MNARSTRITASFTAIALVAGSLSLQGCTTTQEARIGPNDGTDVCYPQRVALDDTRQLFSSDVLQTALAIGVGAAVGIGIAALTGNTNTASLAMGAIAGGIAGGFFDQLVAKQGRDQALSTTLTSAKAEQENMRKTQAAMDALNACRKQEIRQVKADYKAGRIKRPEAEARMAAIRARIDRDYEIAQEINGNITKRSGEFQTALGQAQQSGKGSKERQLASETSNLLTRGQGVGKSTLQLANTRNEASSASLEAVWLPMWHATVGAG